MPLVILENLPEETYIIRKKSWFQAPMLKFEIFILNHFNEKFSNTLSEAVLSPGSVKKILWKPQNETNYT